MTWQQVIRSYRAMAGLSTRSAPLIRGVGTLFLLETELETLGVLIANTAFTTRLALLEILAGVVAATISRRPSVHWSIVIVCAGRTLSSMATSTVGGGLMLLGAAQGLPSVTAGATAARSAVSYRPNDASLLTCIAATVI